MIFKVILFIGIIVWITKGIYILGTAQGKSGTIINKFPNIKSHFWSGFMTALYFMSYGPYATRLIL